MSAPVRPGADGGRGIGETDVLITGAGPVGLALALALARRGVRSTVVERKPALDPHSRATLIVPRSLEILAGLGVLDRIVAEGEVNPAIDLRRAADRSALLRFAFTPLAGRTAVPFAVALPQDRTERILLDAALATGLVDVRFAAPLLRFHDGDAAVTAEVGGAGGDRSLRARYLVGADGAHSTVRRQLGWALEGTTYPTRAFLADVRVAPEADVRGVWLADPAARSFTVAVRFAGGADGGVWRLIESAVPDTVTDDELPARARAVTERIFGPGAWRATRWTAAYRKHERRTPAQRRGRVLLAGDAAHLNSPAGGQGLNAGLQDVQSLAWRLAHLVDGAGDEDRLLDSHSEERIRAFDADVRPLTRGIEQMETLPARLRSVVFSAVGLVARSPLPGIVAGRLSMLAPARARSVLLRGPDPVGRLLPDVALAGGGRVHDLVGPSGLLLTPTGERPGHLAAGVAVARTPDALPAPFAGHAALLVRPDHLVAAVGDAALRADAAEAALGLRPVAGPVPAAPARTGPHRGTGD